LDWEGRERLFFSSFTSILRPINISRRLACAESLNYEPAKALIRAITNDPYAFVRIALFALVQACEELGVEHEARTGHKAVQHVKIRRCGTTMMLGTGQQLLRRSPDE